MNICSLCVHPIEYYTSPYPYFHPFKEYNHTSLVCNLYIAIIRNFSGKINEKANDGVRKAHIFMEQKLRQIDDISLGSNLRKLRNSVNLTQEQVVAQLQLRNIPTSRSAYSQIEAGTYNIKISALIALTEIFHTDLNTIFNGLSYDK